MLKYFAVWLDHNQARLFEVDPEGLHSEVVKAHPHPKHGGHRVRQNDHAEGDVHFFADVAHALLPADQVLVVGPGTAKLQFMRWLHVHAAKTEAKVVAIESADHPTDGQMFAYAKRYFHTDIQPE